MAICKYLDQQMWWRPESGGWRAGGHMRLRLMALSRRLPAVGDMPPFQFIVQFVKPDPSMRPILP
jgi:hypothetical protein